MDLSYTKKKKFPLSVSGISGWRYWIRQSINSAQPDQLAWTCRLARPLYPQRKSFYNYIQHSTAEISYFWCIPMSVLWLTHQKYTTAWHKVADITKFNPSTVLDTQIVLQEYIQHWSRQPIWREMYWRYSHQQNTDASLDKIKCLWPHKVCLVSENETVV